MKPLRIACALAMLALAATDASAEPGQIFFDCDATPGHFSRMEVMLPPQKERLTGSLKAEMLYREGEWMPAAQLRLSEADGENWIGIKLVADVPARKVVRDGATADVVIMRKAGARPVVETKVGTVMLGQSVPFEISAREGRFFIDVAGSSRAVDTSLREARKIELGCTTGDFKFIDILAH
jgi:hypothetical protein